VAFNLANDKKIRRSITNSLAWPENNHRAQERKAEATSKRASRCPDEQPLRQRTLLAAVRDVALLIHKRR